MNLLLLFPESDFVPVVFSDACQMMSVEGVHTFNESKAASPNILFVINYMRDSALQLLYNCDDIFLSNILFHILTLPWHNLCYAPCYSSRHKEGCSRSLETSKATCITISDSERWQIQ